MSCREKKARTWDKDCGAGSVRGLSLRRQKEKTDAKKGGRSMCRYGVGGTFQAERVARANVLRREHAWYAGGKLEQRLGLRRKEGEHLDSTSQ